MFKAYFLCKVNNINLTLIIRGNESLNPWLNLF